MNLRPIVILGPTASGKSSLGIRLARHFNGEIVSLDAYQIYRGLDIATAKEVHREGVEHHLIDIVDLSYSMSVNEFQGRARDVIADIQSRNRVPILVGGSALYIQAVLYDFEFQPTDPIVREKLEDIAYQIGASALHKRLIDIDPEAARRIAEGDVRRTIRALEVNELTGTHYKAVLDHIEKRIEHIKIGLRIENSVLRERVRLRVKEMFSAGLVSEVVTLEKTGLFQSPTASKAIGYEDAWRCAQREISEQDAIELITAKTMAYARKQMKWFKRDTTIHWFDAEDPVIFESVSRFLSESVATSKD